LWRFIRSREPAVEHFLEVHAVRRRPFLEGRHGLLVLAFERRKFLLAVFFHQHFDLEFSLLERCLALAGERDAALEMFERRIQPEVALFQRGHDFFQFL